MTSNKLEYEISANASKFLAAAKEAQKAAEAIGKASGGGSGGSGSSAASGIKAQTDALEKHAKTVANLSDRYKMLEQSRARWEKNPQAINEINKQQTQLLRTMEKQAKTEEDYSKALNARLNLQKQNAQYSAHSQRQNEQLKGLGLQIAGQGLMQIGGYGQALYNSSVGSYAGLNSSLRFDRNLTASQNRLGQAQLNLGRQLAPYEQVKNNLLANITGSQYAAPLSILGDVVGNLAGPVGGGLQLFGLLKNLKAPGGAGGGMAGAAGSAVGAAAKSGGLKSALTSLPVLGGIAAMLYTGADMIGDTMAYGDYEKQVNASFKSGKLSKDEAGKLLLAKNAHKATPIPFGSELAGIGGLSADQEAALQKKAGLGQASTADLVKQFSPVFKAQQTAFVNQIKDFTQDIQRERTMLKRGYDRQEEDIAKSKKRENEDYRIQQQRFGIQRGRLNEDFTRDTTRTNEDHLKALTRLEQDTTKARTRANEDYGRQVQQIELSRYRVTRDTSIQLQRLDEDQLLHRTRAYEDYSRTISRATEDNARTISRLSEDTNRERARADQDYARSRLELERNTARSMQDLNQGLQDSLLSIMAPGLASNKGFQLAKLFRDYNKNKTRLNEDSQFQREGLDIGHNRAMEDINRSQQRGLEDAERELTRTFQDATQSFSRAIKDLDIEQARASFDALKAQADALQDSDISLRNAQIDHARALFDIAQNYDRSLFDINQNYARSMQDINTQYQRAMQDLQMAEADAARNHQRALEDLATAEKRTTEDFISASQQLDTEVSRFMRDADAQLQQMMLDWSSTLKQDISETKNLFADARNALQLAQNQNNAPSTPSTSNGLPNAAKNIPLLGQQDNQPQGKGLGSGVADIAANLPGLPKYSVGTGYVPDDQIAFIHKGEMVIPNGVASQLRNGNQGDKFSALGLGLGNNSGTSTGGGASDAPRSIYGHPSLGSGSGDGQTSMPGGFGGGFGGSAPAPASNGSAIDTGGNGTSHGGGKFFLLNPGNKNNPAGSGFGFGGAYGSDAGGFHGASAGSLRPPMMFGGRGASVNINIDSGTQRISAKVQNAAKSLVRAIGWNM